MYNIIEVIPVERRLGNVIASKAGGTAGRGAKTYKLSLPTAWVQALGLAEEHRRVVLSFDGDAITIRPIRDMEVFKALALSKGHTLLELRYYSGDVLCTRICADQTSREVYAENCTDQLVKTAFGTNALPTWEDFESFLEERCIPRERAGLREYLEALGLEEYDPLAIVRKTQGHMAEDDQWLEVLP